MCVLVRSCVFLNRYIKDVWCRKIFLSLPEAETVIKICKARLCFISTVGWTGSAIEAALDLRYNRWLRRVRRWSRSDKRPTSMCPRPPPPSSASRVGIIGRLYSRVSLGRTSGNAIILPGYLVLAHKRTSGSGGFPTRCPENYSLSNNLTDSRTEISRDFVTGIGRNGCAATR